MGSSNDLPTRVKYILPDEEMELNGFWVLGCWVCCVKNSGIKKDCDFFMRFKQTEFLFILNKATLL